MALGEYNVWAFSKPTTSTKQRKTILTGIMWQCKHACPKIQYKTNKNHSHACPKIQYKLAFSLCIASIPNYVKIIPSAPPVTSAARNSTKPLGLGFESRAHHFLFIFHQSIFLRKSTLVICPPRMSLIGVDPLV